MLKIALGNKQILKPPPGNQLQTTHTLCLILRLQGRISEAYRQVYQRSLQNAVYLYLSPSPFKIYGN